MKLLKEFTSVSEAENFSDRLRAKGILTHVSSVSSNQLGALATGAVNVGVWAVLSNQVNDGLALLENHRHEVSNPLTEEEMVALEDEAKIELSGSVNKLLNKAAVALALIVIGVAAIYVLSSS